MTLKAGIKLFVLILCVGFRANGQYILNGKITFERRTNLEKKFTDQRMRRMITEENKIRNELFTLYFNDTASVFKAIPTDKVDDMAWMTTKNSYYQNLNSSKQITVLGLMGQNVYVSDSLPSRNWKITDSKRSICGYDCRKAVYQKNDSTRIYAWYTTALVPSVGPEGFCGLPGTILGLATEDGGIIYFAKKVEEMNPSQSDMTIEIGKNKVFTLNELRIKIEKDYGNMPWGKRMFEDLFRWL
ncbi:MAG: GLPGLI family protein [Crocinitomicaceae bacterium]|jgi:GLPGLI family protein